jgi:hypothetical protein
MYRGRQKTIQKEISYTRRLSVFVFTAPVAFAPIEWLAAAAL